MNNLRLPDRAMLMLLGVLSLLALFGFFRLLVKLALLQRSPRKLPLIKQIGHVRIPASLLCSREDLMIVIAHELTHHRHRDTVWIHA